MNFKNKKNLHNLVKVPFFSFDPCSYPPPPPKKNPQKTSGMYNICYGTYLYTPTPRLIAGIYIYAHVFVSASLTAYAIPPQQLDGIK